MEGNGNPLQQNTTGGKGVRVIEKLMFDDLTKIRVMAKEIRNVTDSLKAAELLQTNKWVAYGALIQADGQICWMMLRVA